MRPTSATGPDPIRSAWARPNGFTLVELLVVLVIVSLAAATVMLTIPRGRDDLELEARRLAARIAFARDEATVTGRPMALRPTADGYAFEVRDGSRWRTLGEPPFRPVSWRDGAVLSIEERGVERITFDGGGWTEPVTLSLRRGLERRDIEIDAAGAPRVVEAF